MQLYVWDSLYYYDIKIIYIWESEYIAFVAEKQVKILYRNSFDSLGVLTEWLMA